MGQANQQNAFVSPRGKGQGKGRRHKYGAHKNGQVVIVVDPYSSGRFLVQELLENGEKIVAVRTTLNMTDALIMSFKPELYHGVYDVRRGDDIDVIARHLEKKFGKPKAVFTGSEPGVMLSDALKAYWKFPCNDPNTSELRRNKALQQDCLRDSGLRAIKQLYSADINEMLAFRRRHLQFPVVVKPAMSAGTDGVYFCSSEHQIREAVNQNLGKVDILGCRNDKVLLQEFLQGTEYVLDTFSKNGEHVLAAIWVYKKDANWKSGSITYDYTQLIESRGEIQDQLIDYMMSKGGVLDALGIQNGPSHAEIMMTPSGPCLVECGNRMHGCDGPKTVELCTGVGQHNIYADVALGDGQIFEHWKVQDRYVLYKHAVALSLTNAEENGLTGTLAQDVNGPALQKACERSAYIIDTLSKGDELKLTRCLLTSPGEILLMHEDLNIIREDCAAVRVLEKSGTLYVVEQPQYYVLEPEMKDGGSLTCDTATPRPSGYTSLSDVASSFE